MISMHSHSGQFCRHAKGTLREVVCTAIEKGFIVYGLSEHQPRSRQEDMYPDEDGLSPIDLHSQFEEYIIEAQSLKMEFKSKIRLLIGMETEYINNESLDDAIKLRERYGFDYVVGSVHHVMEHSIDYDESGYSAIEVLTGLDSQDATEAVFQKYFTALLTMITTLKPQVVAHFDLCRMFRPNHLLSEKCWQIIRETVDAILKYDGLVEINSRAWKKNLDCAYPFPDILGVMIGKGIKFTISDDAHGPDDVGMHYLKLFPYLKKHGISSIYIPGVKGNELLII